MQSAVLQRIEELGSKFFGQFPRIFGEYYVPVLGNERGRVAYLERFQAAIECLRNTDRKLVLNVGCGMGVETVDLASYCQDLIGLDVEEKYLEIARDLAARIKKTNIDFILGDGRSLPFRPNAFSSALAIETLHHLRPYEKQALREMVRVVRPQSAVVVMDHNAWSLVYVLYRTAIKKWGWRDLVNPRQIERVLSELGAKEISIKAGHSIPLSVAGKLLHTFQRMSRVLRKIPFLRNLMSTFIVACRKAESPAAASLE